MFNFFSSKRFIVQLILVFTEFTLGTVVALGVPVALLLERQTNHQLQALLDQSRQTTYALLSEKSIQLQNYASLLVERPTLNQLVFGAEDRPALTAYLHEFIQNTEIDAISVCFPGRDAVTTGPGAMPALCETSITHPFNVEAGEVWLLSTANIDNGDLAPVTLVLGQSGESVLDEFRLQTGLDYALFFEDELALAESKEIENVEWRNLPATSEDYQIFKLRKDHPAADSHIAAIISLPGQSEFDLVGLLDIEPFTVVSRQVRGLTLAILLSVSLVGAVVAVFLSRRISKPLNQLAQSAEALRNGDLSTPLPNVSEIWEIDQLTNALEDARVGLKHSLDQLRTDKAWMESLLNSIVEGLITIDETMHITFASDAIERIMGVGAAQFLGASVDDYFVPIPGEDLFSQQIPDNNQSRRIPLIMDGNEVLLSVSTSTFLPAEAGNATRALLIRDVTDEERIHRLVGEFMANITHEFRTPLTALSASVELLVDELPTLSKQETGELLQALNIGIIDLQSLIDNLIEAASIEAGRFKVNPRPVELDTIITDSVNAIQPIVKKYHLQIIMPKERQSYRVMADKRRTCQVLINLLSNAIKHSPNNGKIMISTLILDKDVMVQVQDEGAGISVALQSQLFNRFISPQPGEDTQLGMGLGLSVVKAVVEAQQGKVGFKNIEGGGAMFWFTLPLVDGKKE